VTLSRVACTLVRAGYADVRRRCPDLPSLGGWLLLGKHYAHPGSKMLDLTQEVETRQRRTDHATSSRRRLRDRVHRRVVQIRLSAGNVIDVEQPRRDALMRHDRVQAPLALKERPIA
jgi:hypothetical protein